MKILSVTVGLVLALTSHCHSLQVRAATTISPEDNSYWTAVFNDLKPEDLQLFVDQGYDLNKDKKLSYDEFLRMVIGDYTMGTSEPAPTTETPAEDMFDANSAANGGQTGTGVAQNPTTTDGIADQAQLAAIKAQAEAEKQMALVTGQQAAGQDAAPTPTRVGQAAFTPVQATPASQPIFTANPGANSNYSVRPTQASSAQLPYIPVLPMPGSAPRGTGVAATANNVAALVAKPRPVSMNNPNGLPKLAYNPDLYVQGGANVRAVLNAVVVPVLYEGQSLSGGCGYQLTMQKDHNMVISTPVGVLWSLKSAGAWPFVTKGLVLVLNTATGRLEMRSQDPRQRNMLLWRSENTIPGNRAIFGPDGQLVLINSAMDIVWSTGIPSENLCPFQKLTTQ